ncbi:transglycosylase SLT domain-containing protein [Defluviimonas sp. WL0075]|uniref:Transglycosylase SLT domain-containing protein n=1 Tax=Albidovulum sediminicola TaxID=2984331 RepID=A0ABT2YX80_9RHOB|nr:transglycosylase SLT domain-containing protein [Defluviimonas sp. WL0075]MCV2863131.1 transglycosylase SLT domain-containing protein [Defluviimonas sp. WL0075]
MRNAGNPDERGGSQGWILVGLLALLWAGPAASAPDPSSLCDRAAEAAARETGVPVSVLYAVSRAETGRRRQGTLAPWPWTVNMEGAGRWFDTVAEARTYVEQRREAGARSFDIGCFQINHLWHGKAFASVEEMFEPGSNARYAATFLKSLFAETGSWTEAAGAYHSRTPALAGRYAERFARIHDTILAGAPTEAAPAGDDPDAPPVRANLFPLLLAGSTRGRGSLVPMPVDAAPIPLFAANPRVMY